MDKCECQGLDEFICNSCALSESETVVRFLKAKASSDLALKRELVDGLYEISKLLNPQRVPEEAMVLCNKIESIVCSLITRMETTL